MSWTPQELTTQHRNIIRLAFTGVKGDDIAKQVGMTRQAVACILRSPLAQAEIARLEAMADETATNIPMRVRMIGALRAAGRDAVRVNHELLVDDTIDPRVRAGIGRHFIDRVIYDKDEDQQEGSYREILRKLDSIEKGISPTGAILLPPVTHEEVSSSEGQETEGREAPETEILGAKAGGVPGSLGGPSWSI